MPTEPLLYLWDWFLPRIPSDVSYQIVPDQIFKMALCTVKGDTFMNVAYSLTELRDRLLKSLPRTYSPLYCPQRRQVSVSANPSSTLSVSGHHAVG